VPQPIRPDHPGLTEPGPASGERYLCPFCDWYLDRPALTPDTARIPRGARPANLEELVSLVVFTEAAMLDRQILDHLVEEHSQLAEVHDILDTR